MLKKLIFIFCLFPVQSFAWWGSGTTKELGRFVETYAVTVATGTAVPLYDQSFENVTTDIFNSGSYTIYIGTNTATLETTGFPILSNTTYTIDGQHTSVIYAITAAAAGASAGSARIIRYKTGAQ